jgi:hypothetical protein
VPPEWRDAEPTLEERRAYAEQYCSTLLFVFTDAYPELRAQYPNVGFSAEVWTYSYALERGDAGICLVGDNTAPLQEYFFDYLRDFMESQPSED